MLQGTPVCAGHNEWERQSGAGVSLHWWSHLRYLCRVLQVITLKGPFISMGVPYIHAGGNASVSVPVQLSGPNMLPVSAGVSIAMRTLTQGEESLHDDLASNP